MALLKIDWSPDRGKLMEFGRNLIIVAAALAAVSWFKGHHHRAAWLAGLGCSLGALTWAVPEPLGRAVYKAWMSVAFVIGSVVNGAALVLLYYGVLTPLALALRLAGRDALGLRGPDKDSYWLPLPPPPDKSSWERLY